MTEDRRKAVRLESSARALWHTVGDDYLQLDRVHDVSSTGAFVATDAIARPSTLVRLELHDQNGARIAEGTARVVRVDPGKGMGIEFVTLQIDPEQAAESAPPPRPPPLPGQDAADDDDAWAAPEIEPLQVPDLGDLIIGIDLGTTNTCVSWYVDGRPQIIPGRTGGSTIPSVVNFDADGRVHIGQRAVDRQILYPHRTVYGSKRLLGRTYRDDLAEEMQAHFSYPLGEAHGQRFGVIIDERVVSMDEIAAIVLKEVRSTAEDHLQRPVTAAVITVPAYFSEVQREAVRRAARDAELTVHRIVNEPTAAAVAYGHHRGEHARIAVWDFGGGTFDFSIVDIENERYEVVATGGDNFVGGGDFDNLLASYLLEEFMREEGLEHFEATPQQVARLREAGELAKRALSVQTEYDVRLPELTREPRRELNVTVTREVFEERTAPLVQRTVSIAQGVMLSAGIMPAEIDDVVLVGGSTRVPAVQQAVELLFERRPSKRINPDEAVALGAGLLAHEIRDKSAPTLLDLLPMTVGQATAGRQFAPIVKRNARLPCSATVSRDADLLGMVLVPLFQGEKPDATQNEYLCTVVVEDARLRDGGRAQVRLSFDEHCVMAVEAFDERTGKPVGLTLDRERPLEEILRELGMYEGPEEQSWQLPESKISKVLGKIFGLFRKKR